MPARERIITEHNAMSIKRAPSPSVGLFSTSPCAITTREGRTRARGMGNGEEEEEDEEDRDGWRETEMEIKTKGKRE